MNKTGQGILQQNKLIHLLVHILLLLTFFLTHSVSAEILTEETSPNKKNTHKHHVFIIYSPESTLQSNIIQKISDTLNLKRPDIVISKVSAEEKIKIVDSSTDIIIGIGHAGIQSANKYYPKIKKLFITTAPNKYRLDKNKNKKDAILYMSQSYCRQIGLIKLLNINWKTISILNSHENPIESTHIQQCANKFDIKIYTVNTTVKENLTSKIKNALNHSDVLLALPDSNIYNSKTAKNILLTSYRYRKPVIAFSKNFVDAGALASIYSNTEQIAQSASKLIEQYFDSDKRFIKQINFPDAFDININRQVFRALDLSIPDINNLKQSLQLQGQDNSVESL